jgi:hypothetical protein
MEPGPNGASLGRRRDHPDPGDTAGWSGCRSRAAPSQDRGRLRFCPCLTRRGSQPLASPKPSCSACTASSMDVRSISTDHLPRSAGLHAPRTQHGQTVRVTRPARPRPASAALADRARLQAFGGTKLQRFGVAEQVDGTDLGPDGTRDQMGDPVKPLLPLATLRQGIAQAAQKLAAFGFAAFGHRGSGGFRGFRGGWASIDILGGKWKPVWSGCGIARQEGRFPGRGWEVLCEACLGNLAGAHRGTEIAPLLINGIEIRINLAVRNRTWEAMWGGCATALRRGRTCGVSRTPDSAAGCGHPDGSGQSPALSP